MNFIALCCILVVSCVLTINCQSPEVEIPQGRLAGSTATDRDGGIYYSFQSIPYGKPPVGELRFRATELANGWDGILDATQSLPRCRQSGSGQEDCLYLNIFTPGLPSENVTGKPVMVYIHGGGFSGGGGAGAGPAYLVARDVIVVAINYRVGIFGFLSLDDPDLGVTGNAGLKDQSLALQWIKNNIEYFGGDSNNILIFGESAGGMSVHFHVLSPMSSGLFNKAISESGCTLTDGVTPEFRNNAVLMAEAVGIQTENWEEMIATLQSLSADTLSEAQQVLSNEYEYFIRPIVEIPSNEPTFIDVHPLDIIKSGNYNHVPYIIGFNSAEGLASEIGSLSQTGESVLIEDFTEFVPGDFQLEVGSDEEATVAERIKKFYYGDEEPSRDDISGAVYLETDFIFGFGAYRSTIEHLKNALNPIYFYIFNADTRLNLDKYGKTTFPGASHGEELYYLFYSMRTPSYEEGSVEDLAVKNIVSLWTNFAIYGNPTPDGFDYKWEPVQQDQFNYLQIDSEESTLQVDPNEDRFTFWMELYTDYFPDV